jgi:D-alanyl-D-alanine carboxypeptidase
MSLKLCSIIAILFFWACQSPIKVSPDEYDCVSVTNTLTDSTKIAKLNRLLSTGYEHGWVGMALAVSSDDGVWYGSIGMADIPNTVPVSPCSQLRIGSFTKPFVAATVLRLCMENKLSINDKVSDYVDKDIASHIANGQTVTIKQLLNHTSKIPDYFTTDLFMEGMNSAANRLSGMDLLKRIYDKPALADNEYSNSNYLLLGLVISSIEHKSAYDVIYDQVLSPLSLTNTVAKDEEPPGLIRSYASLYGNGKIVDVTDIDNGAVGGKDNTAGGMISNVGEFVSFMQALSDTGFLDSATRNQMMEKVWWPPSAPLPGYDGYCLGLCHFDTKYGNAVGHLGNVYGFNGLVINFMEKHLCFAILVNSISPDAIKTIMTDELYDYFF